MADVYLFDGYNLLHAGSFADPRELVDTLASFVALRGARGVVVFDGVGLDYTRGPLEVRFAEHADTLLESLAVGQSAGDHVTAGRPATRRLRLPPVAELPSSRPRPSSAISSVPAQPAETPRGLAGKLDDETRARLERLRRGE